MGRRRGSGSTEPSARACSRGARWGRRGGHGLLDPLPAPPRGLVAVPREGTMNVAIVLLRKAATDEA
eukprot:3821779-Alexandrium_andersonii.AAC.1